MSYCLASVKLPDVKKVSALNISDYRSVSLLSLSVKQKFVSQQFLLVETPYTYSTEKELKNRFRARVCLKLP
jgi:hypothetical protein